MASILLTGRSVPGGLIRPHEGTGQAFIGDAEDTGQLADHRPQLLLGLIQREVPDALLFGPRGLRP